MMFAIDSVKDHLIRQAIREKRLLRSSYADKVRIAEPHDYGVQNSKVRLLSYQVGGESNSGRLSAWRWLDVYGMSDISLEERHFKGGRGMDWRSTTSGTSFMPASLSFVFVLLPF